MTAQGSSYVDCQASGDLAKFVEQKLGSQNTQHKDSLLTTTLVGKEDLADGRVHQDQ